MDKPKGRQPHTLLKNVHSGEDIWVLASGPSMNYIDPSFFENKLTIGVNRIVAYFNCDYVVTKDPTGFEKIQKHLGNGSLIISKHRAGEIRKRETEIDCDHYYFTHPGKIPIQQPNLNCVGTDDIVVSWSTLTSAIHMAAYMGAKNIILCGHDCGTIDGEATIKEYYKSATPAQKTIQSYVEWVSNDIEAHTVALKRRLKEVYFNCDYVVTKDPTGFEKIQKHLGNGSLIISKHRAGEIRKRETEIDCDHYYFTHPGKIPIQQPNLNCVGTDDIVVSWSTLTSAIHMAAYMGAKNIILCGHDCGTIDGEATIKEYYKSATPAQKTIQSYVEWVSNDIEAHTVALKRRLKEVYGTNVYSLNPFMNFNLEGHEYRSGNDSSGKSGGDN